MAFGVCTNCSSSFPPSTNKKWKILQKKIDIATTRNDEICYVCFRPPLCVFHPIWVLGGGRGGLVWFGSRPVPDALAHGQHSPLCRHDWARRIAVVRSQGLPDC